VSFQVNRALHRVPGVRRTTSTLGTLAVVGLLTVACQAGGTGAGSVTATPTVAPTATATASPAPSASASSGPTLVASPTATAEAAAIDPRTDGLDVTFGEFAITLEADVIRPGKVTLVVHNAGQMTHGFEMKIESSGSGSGGDRKKIETRTFHSGETLRVEADLSPGTYEVECYVDGHASKGMRTMLTVKAGAPLMTPVPGGTATGTVRIVQFAFVPASLDVAAGTRVTWANDDPTAHTVTADDKAFDSKQLDPGASFSMVLATPGSHVYHCEIHPTMVGTVVVH
jgi:plastocyanin